MLSGVEWCTQRAGGDKRQHYQRESSGWDRVQSERGWEKNQQVESTPRERWVSGFSHFLCKAFVIITTLFSIKLI